MNVINIKKEVVNENQAYFLYDRSCFFWLQRTAADTDRGGCDSGNVCKI